MRTGHKKTANNSIEYKFITIKGEMYLQFAYNGELKVIKYPNIAVEDKNIMEQIAIWEIDDYIENAEFEEYYKKYIN